MPALTTITDGDAFAALADGRDGLRVRDAAAEPVPPPRLVARVVAPPRPGSPPVRLRGARARQLAGALPAVPVRRRFGLKVTRARRHAALADVRRGRRAPADGDAADRHRARAESISPTCSGSRPHRLRPPGSARAACRVTVLELTDGWDAVSGQARAAPPAAPAARGARGVHGRAASRRPVRRARGGVRLHAARLAPRLPASRHPPAGASTAQQCRPSRQSGVARIALLRVGGSRLPSCFFMLAIASTSTSWRSTPPSARWSPGQITTLDTLALHPRPPAHRLRRRGALQARARRSLRAALPGTRAHLRRARPRRR